MIRKLFSVTLCAFALLLLMGASSVPEQTVTIVAEEGSVPTNSGVTLETDKVSDEAVHGAAGASLIELAENTRGSQGTDPNLKSEESICGEQYL